MATWLLLRQRTQPYRGRGVYIYIYIYIVFSSLRVFGLLSSSLLLFPQRFTWRNVYRRWFPKLLMGQSSGGYRFNPDCRRVTNTGILNTCTRLWLTESEQTTPVDSIKDVLRSSVKIPEFDKHLKKAGGNRPKRCGNNNKDEDNSTKTLNDKNHKGSSQKFWQLMYIVVGPKRDRNI